MLHTVYFHHKPYPDFQTFLKSDTANLFQFSEDFIGAHALGKELLQNGFRFCFLCRLLFCKLRCEISGHSFGLFLLPFVLGIGYKSAFSQAIKMRAICIISSNQHFP